MGRIQHAEAAPTEDVFQATVGVIEKLVKDPGSADDPDTRDTVTGYRGVKVIMFYKSGVNKSRLPDRFMTVEGPERVMEALDKKYRRDKRVENTDLWPNGCGLTIEWL
jgi:hypothetical protein